MTDSLERRVECESGKLLARVCVAGVKLWCERHRREELFTWGQLEAMRASVNPADVRASMSDHTEALSELRHVV